MRAPRHRSCTRAIEARSAQRGHGWRRVAASVMALLLSGSGMAAPASGSSTENTYLTAAIRLYNDLEFTSALEQFRKAEKYSTGPADDVLIHSYEGMIELEDGKSADAEADFKVALSLDLSATLPGGTSPKTLEFFERVRSDLKSQRIALPPNVMLVPDGGFPDAGAPDAGNGIAPPDLRPVSEPDAGLAAVSATSPSPFAVPSPMPGYIVGGSGAALVVAGVIMGLVANSNGGVAQSDAFQVDANNDLNLANQEAAVSYALLGVGAAAVGVGVTLLVMHWTQESPEPASSSKP